MSPLEGMHAWRTSSRLNSLSGVLVATLCELAGGDTKVQRVDVQWVADFVLQVALDRAAVDTPDELADDVAEGEVVIRGLGAGLEGERKIGDRGARALPVDHHGRVEAWRRVGDARGV